MLINLLLIQAITFIGIFFLLRYLFSRHLNTALERLNNLHEENLVKEQQLTEELKKAKEEGEAEVNRGKEEARVIIEEARKEAIKLRQVLEEQAKVRVDKIVADGNIEVERLKEKSLKDAQAKSVEMAMEVVELVLSQQNKENLQHQLIDEVIEEIGKLPKEQFTTFTETVKVKSSHPLLESEKQSLIKVLNDKTNTSLNIQEEVDSGLIGGLILDIGGLVIDGTLKNKLHRSVSFLKKK
ncbi:MAG: ATP synthase subunit delta [Candidatus Omnitrophica bacterium ADurb.Bin205]|nr:MAG: ATP synthase subunit delta [Candidatus Omnitrophica bacterium ADurb.Bin205]